MANDPDTSVGTFGDPLLHPGWDYKARWELRSRPMFRRYSEIRPGMPTNNSKVVYLPVHKYEEVAANRHVVDEVVSPDIVQSQETDYVRLTVAEHGHPIGRTTFLDDVAYIPVDPVLLRKLVTHMVDTLDAMAADELYDGDQTRNDGSETGDVVQTFSQVVSSNAGALEDPAAADNTLVATDIFSARIARRLVARLRNASAPTFAGDNYIGIMSPDTAVDFQEDTGAIGWSEPHINVDTEALYTSRIGRYAGTVWVEHPRARNLGGVGSGGAQVNQTLVLGREVLGEYVIREPGPGVSPKLDTFNRHKTVYWYGTLGFAIFRQEPLWRVHHGVSS